MDVALTLKGLSEEFSALLEAGDYEGAEELLAQALGVMPKYEPFIHFQYGRLYARWNKLTSAGNHLVIAAEMAQSRGDELFLIQVTEELRAVRQKQEGQRP